MISVEEQLDLFDSMIGFKPVQSKVEAKLTLDQKDSFPEESVENKGSDSVARTPEGIQLDLNPQRLTQMSVNK